MVRVVKKVSDMASPNRKPGGPKRKVSTSWLTPKAPKYDVKPGTGLDGYTLDKDIIILS